MFATLGDELQHISIDLSVLNARVCVWLETMDNVMRQNCLGGVKGCLINVSKDRVLCKV